MLHPDKKKMAERERFELSVPLRVHILSRDALSTTQPSLRIGLYVDIIELRFCTSSTDLAIFELFLMRLAKEGFLGAFFVLVSEF